MSLLIGVLAAGLAVLFAVGAVATTRILAFVGAAMLSVLAGAAIAACQIARRGRTRAAMLGLAVVLVATGVVLGALYRWPLSGPYVIVLAFSLLLPHLTPVERRASILLAVPVAALAALVSSPDPNWPAATMLGPLGQIGAGLVIGLVLLTLERARAAVEAERSRYRSLVEGAPVGIVQVDPSGRILHANRAAARLFGFDDAAALEGRSIVDHFIDPAAVRGLRARLEVADSISGEVELRRVDGTPFWARHRTRRVRFEGADGEAVGFEGTFEDVTAERAAAQTAARLAAIVESADDAVVGLDPDGRITSWNAAAARLFGRPIDEAVGRPLCAVIGQADPTEPSSVAALVGYALAGQVVRNHERTLAMPDGQSLTISFTISPIAKADGRIVGASLVARDVTDLRRLERELGRIVAERRAVLDALRRIQASPHLEVTADAIARELSTTDGFASAAITVFDTEGEVVQVASWLAAERARLYPQPTRQRVGELLARAAAGPWVEVLGRLQEGSYRAFLAEHGVRQLLYAPLVLDGEPVGLLSLGLREEDRMAAVQRLPAATELAALASALLGTGLVERRRADGARARIRTIIEARAFAIVFQPIVDLASGAVLGYEALTRFADGTSPDRVFAEGARCGLGRELEIVTLEAALGAATPLPANVFIDLNVSPDLVLAKEPLATILGRTGWGTVLEITEHAPIADYEEFRAAVAALGPGVRLAIDDAGAGYASLRHILELRPAFVKLDHWLVVGIDADRSRQAVVAGMVHAAERTGYGLVAEGVERDEERRTLLGLGVRLGQGYLFGRPAPAETWVRQTTVERLRPVLRSLRVDQGDGIEQANGGTNRGGGKARGRVRERIAPGAVSSKEGLVDRADNPGRG